MKKLSIFSFLVACALVFGFQNCSDIKFSTLGLASQSPKKSENNGTGYGGKPSGDFYRFEPQFTCENKTAPVSELHVTATNAVYIENKNLQCQATKEQLDPALVDSSIYQGDVVGYREGIFESSATTPKTIPANLVEVWCRTTKGADGIETLTHYNRQTLQADTEIYRTEQGSQVQTTLIVSRVVGEKKVTVTNGPEFSLEVYRDKPAGELGLFQGSLALSLSGKKVSLATSCRLGGSLDAKVWPVQQIIDTRVKKIQMAPDLSFFGYSSSFSGEPAGLFSATSLGLQNRKLTQPMLSKGVENFEIAPSSDTLVFWGDPRMPYGLELFRVQKDGTQLAQLNTPLTNSQQGQDSHISFSADGKRVYYLDGEQETGPEGGADIEMWLRSVPLTGGTPSLVSIPLPLVGDKAVLGFVISKTLNRVLYLAGGVDAEIYLADGRGQDVVNPFPGLTFEWTTNLNISEDGKFAYFQPFPKFIDGKANYTTYVVAMDGSYAGPMPVNWTVKGFTKFGQVLLAGPDSVLVNGETIFDLKLFDLASGRLTNLPSLGQVALSQNGATLTGIQSDGAGLQALSIDLATLGSTKMCAGISNGELRLTELVNGEHLLSVFNPDAGVLYFYTRSSLGACFKRNSIPLQSAKRKDILLAKDQGSLLVKVGVIADGKNQDQLFYVPLSGKPAFQITAPVFNGASISEMWFLPDSRTVVYAGVQLTPGEKHVFLWRAP